MKPQIYRVIGVMSGTSLDGIDLCEVEFKLEEGKWSFDILKSKTIPYTKEWVDKLEKAHLLSTKELKEFDKAYTVYLAEVIESFIKNSTTLDLICSHGHTVLHQPENGLTYQIGNLPLLAKLLDKTVVCDFRTADVALGGQGAPLVPIGDKMLFGTYDYCINIGGFVNISFENNNQRIAFDICPANKILNYFTSKIGLAYDNNGDIARKGNCYKELLNALNKIAFYKTSPPKSLGVEWLEDQMFPVISRFDVSLEDKLCTLCHHIGIQISKVFGHQSSSVLITGGGAYNNFLIECIKKYSVKTNVIIPDSKLVDFKEAIIFGLLGVLKFRDEINVLSSVTGAKFDHSSGKIFYKDLSKKSHYSENS